MSAQHTPGPKVQPEPGFRINRAVSASPFLSGLGAQKLDAKANEAKQLEQAAALMEAIQGRMEELKARYEAMEADLRQKTSVLEGARLFFQEMSK